MHTFTLGEIHKLYKTIKVKTVHQHTNSSPWVFKAQVHRLKSCVCCVSVYKAEFKDVMFTPPDWRCSSILCVLHLSWSRCHTAAHLVAVPLTANRCRYRAAACNEQKTIIYVYTKFNSQETNSLLSESEWKISPLFLKIRIFKCSACWFQNWRSK